MLDFENLEIPVEEILIDLALRQRQDLGEEAINELTESIRTHGLLCPIIVDQNYCLIAGGRRLEAWKNAFPGQPILARVINKLIPQEYMQTLELIENVQRKDLDWKEASLATYRIHQMYKAVNKDGWPTKNTAQLVSRSQQYVSDLLQVAEALLAQHSDVCDAKGISDALKILDRERARKEQRERDEIDQAINTINEVDINNLPFESADVDALNSSESIEQSAEAAPLHKIICADFTKWIDGYKDRLFHFVHCDFPYGINHQDSEQGGTASGRYESYDDSPEVYWELCGALARNIDKIMLPASHLMFWFSMKYYRQTIDFFTSNTDLKLVMEHPLVWFKSDGKGIVSDHKRRPKNVYETALLFSRGDRHILTVKNNCFDCSSAKTITGHVSVKPEIMLKHFFKMFVDEHCEMLDPTCGSGSSIRAAKSLGAKRALGLEINQDFARSAQGSLQYADILDIEDFEP